MTPDAYTRIRKKPDYILHSSEQQDQGNNLDISNVQYFCICLYNYIIIFDTSNEMSVVYVLNCCYILEKNNLVHRNSGLEKDA